METYASAAWVSTSMPVSAVTEGGTPPSSSASSTATSGRRASSTSGCLIPFSLSVMTAKEVISDPSPPWLGSPTGAPCCLRTSVSPWRSPWRSAAKGHDGLRAALPQHLDSLGHQLQRWVGLHLVEYRHLTACQLGTHPVQQPGGGQKAVRHHRTRFPASSPRADREPAPKNSLGFTVKVSMSLPAFSLMGLVWQSRQKICACAKKQPILNQDGLLIGTACRQESSRTKASCTISSESGSFLF